MRKAQMTGLAATAALSISAAAAPQVTGTLVVLNKAEASASILDCATGKEIARLTTGAGPHEVAISPDGRTAVVADYGQAEPGHTLTVIDLPARKVSKTIDLGEHGRPHGIQYLPDGKRVAVTAEHGRHLLVVNVESGTIEQSTKTDQDVSHMLVLTPDASRVYVANIRSGTASVIDMTSAEVIATIKTGPGAEAIDVSPDGKEVWVGNRAADTISIIDNDTLAVVETVSCGTFPIRLKFTPDGRYVLVSNARSGDVAVIDAATRKPIKRIAMQEKAVNDTSDRLFKDRLGGGPVPVGILIEPKGRLAWVANTNADVVTVIDLKTLTIVDRLTGAGREPDGLGYSPIRLDLSK